MEPSAKKPRKSVDRPYDPTKFDWEKSNKELAAEHNISYDSVTRWRRKLCPESGRTYDPAKFDWTKTSKELAAEHGISIHTVRSWRQKLAPIKRKPPVKNVDPTKFDWQKTTRELAAEHNVSLGYVWLWRRRLAPVTIVETNNARHIDWAKVDWQLTNRHHMLTYGVSHATINKMRALHAPETTSPEAMKQIRLEAQQRLMAERKANKAKPNIDWSLTNNEICHQTGMNSRRVKYLRHQYAPETIKRRHRLPPDADWSLSNGELMNKYNVCLQTVYRARIKNGRKKRPYRSKKHKQV